MQRKILIIGLVLVLIVSSGCTGKETLGIGDSVEANDVEFTVVSIEKNDSLSYAAFGKRTTYTPVEGYTFLLVYYNYKFNDKNPDRRNITIHSENITLTDKTGTKYYPTGYCDDREETTPGRYPISSNGCIVGVSFNLTYYALPIEVLEVFGREFEKSLVFAIPVDARELKIQFFDSEEINLG